jgi:RHS repeat-associated protein
MNVSLRFNLSYISLFILCIGSSIHAQTPTTSKNSVTEQMPRDAMTTLVGTDYTNVQSKISYVDGLGRAAQSVIYRGSADGQKDILASTSLYDIFGRQFKNVIAVASINGNGGFYAKADSLAKIFYQDQNPANEVIAYDNSPLNRIVKSYGVGQAWRTAQKYVEMKYEIEGNGIRLYTVNSNNDGAASTGAYPASSLIKKVMVNERGKETWELTDLAGKTVMRVVQDDTGYMITSYIYDDMERLRFVCPPKFFDLLPTGFLEGDANFKNGIFAYKYDERSRIIAKHVPNAGWTYIIYDKRDLPVMTQDSKDRENNRYQFTKYDAWGRPILSGFVNNVGTDLTARQTIQDAFEEPDGILNPYEKRAETGDILLHYTNNQSFPTTVKPIEANTLTATYYDDYFNWITTNIAFKPDSAYHIPYANSNGVMTGMQYRNLGNSDWLYSSNFYDDKRRTVQQNATNHLGDVDRMDTEYRFNGEVKTQRAIYRRPSQPAITIKTRYRYDHQSRRIALYYILNGDSLKLSGYEFDQISRLLRKSILPTNDIFSKQTGLWTQANTWVLGELPKQNDIVTINQGHTLTIPPNGVAFAGQLNDYGLLLMNNTSTLNMGKPRTAPLQTMDYSYKIRGGLRGINLDANGNIALTNGDLFSFKLSYEDDGTYHNGNIRKQEWASTVDNLTRSYLYSYDTSDRILGAIYGGGKPGENYALENMSYDKNGNIKTLSRKGMTAGTPTAPTGFGNIDQLTYTYANSGNSNQLLKVDDGINGNINVGDFRDVAGNDYDYWADGSLKKDNNKGIDSIRYNHLKLTSDVFLSGNRKITTWYDALGHKLRKETLINNVVQERTDYHGAIIYQTLTTQPQKIYQIAHEEGRAIPHPSIAGKYIHEFSYKDHLGNLRLSFRDSLANNNKPIITQQNAFDPWGLSLMGIDYVRQSGVKDKFGYNSKETEDKFGLNSIDFGFRTEMPDIGRWTSVDIMSEDYFGISPYTYVLNRPTIAVDPDGKRVYFIGGAGNDSDGWNYINRWGQAFRNAGIDFYRVNASHGTGGDVLFTSFYRDNGYEEVTTQHPIQSYSGGLNPSLEYTVELKPVSEEKIDATVSLYKNQLKSNPLSDGEQFNLAGYSYGSVLQAQAALKLATGGQVIDNLILIGSPISDKSNLWKQLNSNKNIKNIIRYDIKGDALSNPQDVYDFIKGGVNNSPLGDGDNGHHFDAARPGQQANQLIQTIIQWLQQQGVKN